ncbi:hypothetical protein DOTSEDRAFT_46814 [Lecanosticta acicola]|uniref:F-box domain-containing protein n=1 Tax=Lecanosticta acicola TaxID=111012 RepID=A0AAI8YVM3_9PEZI|nr:hypothetical protein DOTSEDRAFT_46814 [Lecanosticta acicola]
MATAVVAEAPTAASTEQSTAAALQEPVASAMVETVPEVVTSTEAPLQRTICPPKNPMACLLELSNELLHCIFVEIEPADLSAISRSCRALHSYIRGNRLLHKDLYVRRYDEPPAKSRDANDKDKQRSDGDLLSRLDWEDALHRLVKMEKILDTDDRAVKRDNIKFVADEIIGMMGNAHIDGDESLNIQLLRAKFTPALAENMDTFLCSSSLFARAGNEMQLPADTEELQQLSAKLHCFFGVPIDEVPKRTLRSFLSSRHANLGLELSPSACTRSQSRNLTTHPFARSKVYDLREYTDDTLWGPFMHDGSGRVDWEKVEAIMIVLGYNLNKFYRRSEGRFPQIWKDEWTGATPNSYKSVPCPGPTREMERDEEMFKIRELALSLDAQDPYGVTGSWMRVVCFLDYNDLYAFNFSDRIPDDQLREPIDIEEAIRLIRIKLQVTRIEPPGSGDEDEDDDGMDWSNFQGERLPVVHFRGTSRSLHASWDPNANSRIRGSVRQTPEGEIRWTSFSIFHGEERWRSEGVQVGGIKSARGILGNWFDKDYDLHGPAGPTAFWKETDELDEEKSSSMPVAFF